MLAAPGPIPPLPFNACLMSIPLSGTQQAECLSDFQKRLIGTSGCEQDSYSALLKEKAFKQDPKALACAANFLASGADYRVVENPPPELCGRKLCFYTEKDGEQYRVECTPEETRYQLVGDQSKTGYLL